MADTNVAAIIPCAGKGTRFGADIPKQYIELRGIPIVERTVQALAQHTAITTIVLAVDSTMMHIASAIAARCTLAHVLCVEGGAERQHSIANALATISPSEFDIVLVHDAVRPFVPLHLLQSLIENAQIHHAVIPARTPKETIKQLRNKTMVHQTLQRQELIAVQTPQAFSTELLKQAYANAKQTGLIGTDDASIVEALPHPVHVIEGIEENIKITTPLDFALAELILLSEYH